MWGCRASLWVWFQLSLSLFLTCWGSGSPLGTFPLGIFPSSRWAWTPYPWAAPVHGGPRRIGPCRADHGIVCLARGGALPPMRAVHCVFPLPVGKVVLPWSFERLRSRWLQSQGESSDHCLFQKPDAIFNFSMLSGHSENSRQ